VSASKLVWAARREDLADAPFLAGDRGRSGVAESAELDTVRAGAGDSARPEDAEDRAGPRFSPGSGPRGLGGTVHAGPGRFSPRWGGAGGV
jgi:hypothetical protein